MLVNMALPPLKTLGYVQLASTGSISYQFGPASTSTFSAAFNSYAAFHRLLAPAG